MLRYLGRVVRKHLLMTVLVLTLLAVIGTGAGFYWYAVHQWHEAQAAVKEGRPADSVSSLDVCLWVWQGSPEVHLLAARAARLTGDFDGADSHLKKCMKLQGGATEATQLEYLLMRAQTGEEEEVVAALSNYLANKHPESPLIMETLAGAYMRHLRFGPAYLWLSRWITWEPNNARPYHWRGWVLERLNSSKEAMEDYKRALELDPDLFEVRLRVAEVRLEEKHPLAALPHLERLRKQFPDRPDVRARLGQCRFLQGKGKEARQLLEGAVKELPNDSQLLLHLAKLELQEGRPVQAEEWAKRALKADPADAEAQYELASSLQLQGRKEEAKKAMDQFKKKNDVMAQANKLLKDEAKRPTRDPGPPSKIGILLLHSGQEKAGLHWLNQALLRDRGHRPTHEALAEFWEKKGDHGKAAFHRRFLSEPVPSQAAP
jgi:tetratricopeptide (TPR) repeat protein